MYTNIRSIYLLALTMSTLPVSCSDNQVDEESDALVEETLTEEELKLKEPMVVRWNQIQDGQLEDGQVIQFNSFVVPLGARMFSTNDDISLDFFERRQQTNGYHLSVSIPIGNQKNEIKEIPKEYNALRDVKINTSCGKLAEVGDYVTITGVWRSAENDGKYDYLNLTDISLADYKFDEKSLDGVEELTDEVVENTTDVTYGYIDGKMELGSIFMTAYSVYNSVNIDQSNNQYLESISLMVNDNTINCMNNLPDNYSQEDFLITDASGDTYTVLGEKFRLYGSLVKSSYDPDGYGQFYVEEIVKQ